MRFAWAETRRGGAGRQPGLWRKFRYGRFVGNFVSATDGASGGGRWNRLAGGHVEAPTRRAPHRGAQRPQKSGYPMNRIIYLVGLVVIVLAILSFIGLG